MLAFFVIKQKGLNFNQVNKTAVKVNRFSVHIKFLDHCERISISSFKVSSFSALKTLE